MTMGPRIIAHRGASARAPENTLEACRLAVEEEGAEGLELDVHRTRDGHVVVLHDSTVDRTTDGRGPVVGFTLDELQRLDAGYRFAPPGSPPGTVPPYRGRGIRVPTLREILEAFPRTWLSLDLKAGDPQTELAVVQLIRAVGAEDRAVVGAEVDAPARRLRGLAPELSSFFSAGEARAFYVRHRLRCLVGYRPPAGSLQIPVRHGRHDLARQRLIDDAHRRGIAVRYWTVNDEATMRRLLELGADGIITDRPGLLREVLRQQAA